MRHDLLERGLNGDRRRLSRRTRRFEQNPPTRGKQCSGTTEQSEIVDVRSRPIENGRAAVRVGSLIHLSDKRPEVGSPMRYARPLIAIVVFCTAASVGGQAEAGAMTSAPNSSLGY